MPEPIIEALLAFLTMVFAHEVGTSEFYVVFGCTLLGVVVVARLLAGVFKSPKGIFVAVFAVALPFIVGAVGYVSVELYALPQIEADWAAAYLPWSVFGIVVFVAALLLSAKLWGIGKGVSVFILILSGLAGMGAHYGAQLMLGIMDTGTSQIEQREERLNLEIEKAN